MVTPCDSPPSGHLTVVKSFKIIPVQGPKERLKDVSYELLSRKWQYITITATFSSLYILSLVNVWVAPWQPF